MATGLYTIIGDANVRRNMTGLNVASRESMKSAQIIDFLGLTPIDQALAEIRPESSFCIISALTDPVVANGDCGTVFASVDPVLNSLHAAIAAYCTAHPQIQVTAFPLCVSTANFISKCCCWCFCLFLVSFRTTEYTCSPCRVGQ